jgi:hypothetical protein
LQFGAKKFVKIASTLKVSFFRTPTENRNAISLADSEEMITAAFEFVQ